ncbi:hypothetical protein C8A00DRAFT_42916 [Chaetomidium leptoderma]|uniref:Amine oxidase n=1 Tax=Chaetomidium leptoderma TaxID=669021 RepID=A0AAN6ZY10_9PEZI|nr:hypothetical protein C8A00DRAFT_42916 [Chaetomidium leptoderma]
MDRTDATQRPKSHPLGPLTAQEILRGAALIRGCWPEGIECHFKVVTLLEPPKAGLIPYLAAERAGQDLSSIDRRAFVVYYFRGTHNLHEAVVNLSTSKVEANAKLGPFMHANGDGEEIIAVEEALLSNPDVQAELAKLELPQGSVVVSDPWIYGSDGVKQGNFYDDKRAMQCFLYMRDPCNPTELDSCHYAFPLPISPVVDPVTLELIRIDILPTGLDEKVKPLGPWQPANASEYIPEAQTLRSDLKPLRLVQPEGASFTVENFSELGRLVRWQKWDFKVGFNQREGMVLYDVHYDNKPLFYRLSLSDMSIPYADPRHPFHRKAAFDLGDAGAGIMANNLELGCDCLGSIYYIGGVLVDSHGKPANMPNVICVHEQDAGILWKHTNYRTNRAVVVRNRELVLQTIITVSNYEYILSFVFNTAGDLTYEARATGILSTQPLDLELTNTPHPFGTVVHPGVLGSFHQHFFSLRIDPMVGGHGNSVVYDEAVAIPRDSNLNPHGVGYTVRRTEVDTSGGYDLDTSKNRTFKVVNAAVRNPVNGAAVGYKLMVPPMQGMLADADSFHHKRAEFADHSIYVTRYAERELYAGGLYTNQSRGGTGVRSWADRRDDLAGGDPVLWVQFGINHIPRVEDFPVMPVETLRVMLRPVNFFDRNPAIDVPPSKQETNCSETMSQQPPQTSHPTFINLPQAPSNPDTPSEMPGTPTSTTTSLSALSTTAIKDGHRGTLHHRGHQHNASVNSLEAERADRISRLTGLSGISTLRGPAAGLAQHNANFPQTNPAPAGFIANPTVAGGLSPAYFDAAGQPFAATKMSTVGAASATESIGGRTTNTTEVGGDNSTLGEEREEDMLTEMDSVSASGYMGADAMDEDLDNLTSQSVGGFEDRMSDDGSASLVGFGEGAGSTLSGPIYHRRPLPSQGSAAGAVAVAHWGLERSNSGLSEGANASPNPHHSGVGGRRELGARPLDRDTGADTPVSQSAVRERREARMVDGVALDSGTPATSTAAATADDDVFVDTTTRGPVPVPSTTTGRDTTRTRQEPNPHHHHHHHHHQPQQPTPLSTREAAERIAETNPQAA